MTTDPILRTWEYHEFAKPICNAWKRTLGCAGLGFPVGHPSVFDPQPLKHNQHGLDLNFFIDVPGRRNKGCVTSEGRCHSATLNVLEAKPVPLTKKADSLVIWIL